MIKLVVLSMSVLLAVVVAKPGFLHGGFPLHAPVAVAVPAAVSHSYRSDIFSKPIIATYTVPVIQKTLIAAPVAYHTSPIVAYSGHPW